MEAREAVPEAAPEGRESAPRPRRGLAPPEAPHGPPSGGPADGAPETGPKALVELRGQLVQAREHVQGRRGDRGVPQQRLELAERVRVPAQEERRQRAKPTAAEKFERFKEFTRRLVAVPKAEIDKQARAYRRRRRRGRRAKRG